MLNTIEIGYGGNFSEAAVKNDFKATLEKLQEMLFEYDGGSKIEFIEAAPPKENTEAFAQTASDMKMPYRQFTALYVIGGNSKYPDALKQLQNNISLAKRCGTITGLNMQVYGSTGNPGVPTLIDFYLRAHELADKAGLELFTETHIDRFTYDPRWLVCVNDFLSDKTNGKIFIKVAADLSHYVHQLGNSTTSNFKAISNGDLDMDPFSAMNYFNKNILEKGWVGMGHLRCAVPNDLPREKGSIQYPLVDPMSDPHPGNSSGKLFQNAYDETRTKHWKKWHKDMFSFLLTENAGKTIRFSSEYIGNTNNAGDYNSGNYRDVYQNIAMISYTQKLKKEILTDKKINQHANTTF